MSPSGEIVIVGDTVEGATENIYLVTSADIDSTLSVRASYIDEAGNSESVSSVESATVARSIRSNNSRL